MNGLPLLKNKRKPGIDIDFGENVMKLDYLHDASKTYNWRCYAGSLRRCDWNLGEKSELERFN